MAGVQRLGVPELIAPELLLRARAQVATVRRGSGLSTAWDVASVGMGGTLGPGWRFGQRPSDQNLLTAYGESPWANKKFFRIAASVASLKVTVGTRPTGAAADTDLKPLPDTYPLTVLLARPNPFLDYWGFMFLSMIYARVTGEVYWWKRRNPITRRPVQLWAMPRMWVTPKRAQGPTGDVTSYEVRAFGDPRLKIDVPPEDMIWLWRPDPLDPYRRGVGDMLAAATEIETFEYASETDRQLFLKGGTPPGALVLPTMAPPTEITRLKQDWREKHQGFWNRGEVAVLTGGAKYESFMDSRREMQFVQGQQYLRDVIIAGMHPHILGIVDDVNRANAEAAEYTFARWELQPDVIWVTGPLNAIAAEFDPRVVVELEDPVPANRELESVEARDFNTGAIATVDERRAKIGLQPLPNGEGQVRQIDLRIVEVPLGTSMADAIGGDPSDDKPPPADGQRALPAPARKATFDPMAALPAVDPEAARMLRNLIRAYQHVLEGRTEMAAAELGITIAFDVRDPAVERFLREEAGRRIRRITETTLGRVREALAEGQAAGEAIPDLARRVSAVFDDAKGRRSIVIARTEVLEASNFAAEKAYRESGIVKQIEWLLAPDYTPAIDNGECAPFDGKVVEVGEEFAPGVRFPPLHPQCRCTIAPVINERRLYEGEARDHQIARMGREHLIMERRFRNVVVREFQDQQNRILRALRTL